MRYGLSLLRRLAVASAGSLLCIAILGAAQEGSKTPAKSKSAGQSKSSDPSNAASQSKTPDKSKSPDKTSPAYPKESDKTGMSSGKGKDELDELDEKLKAKKKKEERKPNFRVSAVRTAPFDLAVPYFKPNHWTFCYVDVIANNKDETVEIRSGYESVPETAHEVQFRRITHLPKEEPRLVRVPMLLPAARKNKKVEVGLYEPRGVLAIVPPGIEEYGFSRLEPHQFLIVVLAPEPDKYAFLNEMPFVQADVEDETGLSDRRRYFHLVRPLQPSRPLVADTALGWTTTSYCIWDDLDPVHLTLRQREALLDWLHWGGQLIVSGGAAAAKLEQSFLAPYLPAKVAPVGGDLISDLRELEENYRSPHRLFPPEAQKNRIRIKPDKPIYAAKLEPQPGAKVTVQLNDGTPLVVARPVGRGRVVMAAFSLQQRELVDWKEGYDEFWGREILGLREREQLTPRRLSHVGYVARDLGAGSRRASADGSTVPPVGLVDSAAGAFGVVMPADNELVSVETVAEWRDDTPVPAAARETLRKATGIEIPPPRFVMATAVWYLVTLVPLNWLVCRFGLRRPELAWLAAPVIIVVFSLGIIVLAQQNVGFTMTSREIDVVEAYAGYARAHVSRFTCVYSSSRRRCEFRYENPQAVAMPMALGPIKRGQNVERLGLDWDPGTGVPVSLGRYEIHPRSIGMVRAEEMMNMPTRAAGPGSQPVGFDLQPGPGRGQWVLENQTPWELWDCHWVSQAGRVRIGDVRPGDRIQLPPAVAGSATAEPGPADTAASRREPITDGVMAGHSTLPELGDLQPLDMLELLEQRPFGSNSELIGWMPRPVVGQVLDPSPASPVGFTAFVVHLYAEADKSRTGRRPASPGESDLSRQLTEVLESVKNVMEQEHGYHDRVD